MVEGIGSGDNNAHIERMENVKKYNGKDILNQKISEYFENNDSINNVENKTSETKDIALNTDIKEKASAIKDIRYLQNILANTELYDVDFETQRIFIHEKNDPGNFSVVAHRIVDGSENEENQFYYEFANGNIYNSGDFGFDNINSMFHRTC